MESLVKYFPAYRKKLYYIVESIEKNSFLYYGHGWLLFNKKVEDGLMSGWKVTSIFGSLVNYSIFWTIVDNLGYRYEFCSVLGDDLDTSFSDFIDPELIYNCYDDIKFPIARDKTSFT